LTAGRTYYFAVRVLDEAGNLSELSLPVVSVTFPPDPSSIWLTETVDNPPQFVGFFTSLALDRDEKSHIAHADVSNHDAKYARWTGAGWDIESLPDPIDQVGEWTDLALAKGPDQLDFPTISYVDRTNGDLRVARWTSTGWTFQTVDTSTPGNGNWNSLRRPELRAPFSFGMGHRGA
jgi:hypothetical protein